MTLPRPQRLFLPSPPGSLLKSAEKATTPRKDASECSDAAYLARVRECPCLKCGVEPCGEAAHVKFSSAAFGMKNQMGKRVDDARALPLCRDDHLDAKDAQHKGNEEAFWQVLGIVPYQVTRDLYAQRNDLVAMRFVIIHTISQRGK